MTETDSDCSENTHDKNQNNNRDGSQFHPFNPNDHCNIQVENDYQANNRNSGEDPNIYDDVIEAYKIHNAPLSRDDTSKDISKERNSADAPIDCGIRSRTLQPKLKSIGKYKTMDNHDFTNCVDAQGEEIKELNNESLSNEESLHYRSKRNLMRYRTVDDGNYSYKGVSDRVKKLNIIYSSDKDKEDGTSNLKTSPKQETCNVSEKRKLTIDPEFEQKMNELYYPSPSTSTTTTNNGFCNIKTNEKLTLNRLDSNCEIIEENLSPVSETTKQLEHQLSFPTSPNSQVLSPRFPKKTRFARLNKYLNETSDHENTLSQPESVDQSFFTN